MYLLNEVGTIQIWSGKALIFFWHQFMEKNPVKFGYHRRESKIRSLETRKSWLVKLNISKLYIKSIQLPAK
jgi:hypothetical protein